MHHSSPHTCCITLPSHSSLFDHPKNIGWAVQIIKLLIMFFLHSPVTSSLLGPNILLNTLFSNTISLRLSLNVSDQVPHPYKTTCKITILYIFILKFWIANRKTKDSAPPNDSKHCLISICFEFLPELNFDSLRLFVRGRQSITNWTFLHFVDINFDTQFSYFRQADCVCPFDFAVYSC